MRSATVADHSSLTQAVTPSWAAAIFTVETFPYGRFAHLVRMYSVGWESIGTGAKLTSSLAIADHPEHRDHRDRSTLV